MDVSNFIYDVAQKVSAAHTVINALEYRSDHITAIVTIGVRELAQIGEETWTTLTVRTYAFILIDEGEKFFAGDTLGIGCPVSPPIRLFYGRAELCSSKFSLVLALQFKIIKEL